MLNPFFIQGNYSEQNLVQDLINEQLKIYGIEVYYMPREILSEGKVIRDVIYSKFKSAFPIEAYLVNYDGFDTNSVLMSKFGVKVTDEMTLIISKERFETYIGELMKQLESIKNYLRPNEGDLLYIPLSDSFMEIKYVENRKPFFQLQKTYVYELKCELYELEDDIIDTTISEIDKSISDLEYTAKLTLSGLGITATAYTSLVNNGVQKIDIISGGYRYSSTPTITVSSPISGVRATVVGIMTSARSLSSAYSLDKIYLTNPGRGYISNRPPIVSFFGGGGYAAEVKVSISTSGSIGIVTISNEGQGYTSNPVVTFSSPNVSWGVTATGRSVIGSNGRLSSILIENAGLGYTTTPTITISAGSTVSSGNFIFEEDIFGSISNAKGNVKYWNAETNLLTVVGFGTDFIVGETIVGSASSARYLISKYESYSSGASYDNSESIQEESDDILVFDEINPFGEV